MHPIACIDLVCVLAGVTAAVFLIRGWKRPGFSLAVLILLLILALLTALYGTGLFLEWSKISAAMEWHFLEDFGGVFIPFVWAFVFYAIVKRGVEQELRVSREHFRTLVETTSDWFWEAAADGRITYSSPQSTDILGYSPQELLGRTPFDFMPPSEIPRLREFLQACGAEHKGVYRVEHLALHRDGGEVSLDVSMTPVFDASGRLAGFRGVNRDITLHQKAALELEESRRAMVALIGNLPGIAFRCLNTPDWPMQFISKGCLEMTGYADQEFLCQQVLWNDLIVPHDRTRVWEEIQEALRHHTNYQIEYRIRAKDGTERCLWEKGCGVFGAGGQAAALEGFITDITELVKSKQALMFTQFSVDRASEGTYWITADGKFVYVNDAVCRRLGYSRDQLLTMSVADVDPDFPARRWASHWQELKEKGALRFETRHKTRDGRVFPVEVTANFLVYEGVEYNCALARDITSRKNAEQMRELLMRQLQAKNEELQSIVFIAAHDLRSPLVNLRGFTGELEKDLARLTELLRDPAPPEPARQALDLLLTRSIPESLRFIKAGSQTMETLLNGLTRLSRVGSLQIHPACLDMNAMLQAIVRDTQFQISSIGAEVHLQPDLPVCRGDSVLVSQVFINLLDNALKYRHGRRPCVIRVTGSVCGGGRVEYAVADNGIGIAAEHIEKVFDLFHRLNPRLSNGGEGLGLTIVRRILDRQDGTVRMESVPNIGTTVYVQLPGA
ncbi:MAG: PAS domain S-box protein [Planctomycetales bacterium]|nr:PAS domain S-box protein [Planctomycetales bacterium]